MQCVGEVRLILTWPSCSHLRIHFWVVAAFQKVLSLFSAKLVFSVHGKWPLISLCLGDTSTGWSIKVPTACYCFAFIYCWEGEGEAGTAFAERDKSWVLQGTQERASAGRGQELIFIPPGCQRERERFCRKDMSWLLQVVQERDGVSFWWRRLELTFPSCSREGTFLHKGDKSWLLQVERERAFTERRPADFSRVLKRERAFKEGDKSWLFQVAQERERELAGRRQELTFPSCLTEREREKIFVQRKQELTSLGCSRERKLAGRGQELTSPGCSSSLLGPWANGVLF